jgi:hypothetical protein
VTVSDASAGPALQAGDSEPATGRMVLTFKLRVRDKHASRLNAQARAGHGLSRAQARASGAVRYFTGLPCKNGHIAERQTTNGTCVVCAREIAASCVIRSPDGKRASNAKYYKENADKVGFLNAKWRNENPDEMRVIRQRHYQKNKSTYLAWSRLRDEHVKMATPAWVDKAAIVAVYQEAARLSAETGVAHDVDHIVPLRGHNVCGLHVSWNLRPLPARKNRGKDNNRRWLVRAGQSTPVEGARHV